MKENIDKLVIGGVQITKNTTVTDLLNSKVFETDDDAFDDVIYIDSGENSIDFIGGNFWPEIYFDNSELTEIKLYPDIEDLEEPDYPDEEFELANYNYCKDHLREFFGEPSAEDSDAIQFDFTDFKIRSFRITAGKGEYTGGYISITF